ncbi:hypothetical protein DRE_02838 [Drechslerella stenobrocha 248]|uniref:Ubiquitin-like protease family profile domain-containing protein n=1 Tax=Drechslerella stenobrocha 248 TaxID=1043628 RepID=W7HUU3_9PEZI|nr:hypothetical protein DRE_02838 [Drechslerella stenobrocha 248]
MSAVVSSTTVISPADSAVGDYGTLPTSQEAKEDGIVTTMFKSLWISLRGAFTKDNGDGDGSSSSSSGDGGATVEREEVVEERQELGYTSTFEGNSRKRRRPSPVDDERDDVPTLSSLRAARLAAATTTLGALNRELSGSDTSVQSSSEQPTPSTNPTESPNELLRKGSVIEYTELKWREGSETSIFGSIQSKPTLNGSQQLQRSLQRRRQATKSQGNLLSRTLYPQDRVVKRSSTPASLRSSRTRHDSVGLRASRGPDDSAAFAWPDPNQYSPPSEMLRAQTALRTSVGASAFRPTGFSGVNSTPTRSARLQEQIDRSAKKKIPIPPWRLQREPDALIDDPESLARLIKQLQESKVEGFENYTQVQERQKQRDEKIRELRAPKPKVEVLRDISDGTLAELHKFLTNRDQNKEARRIGGCPVTPHNLRTLSGSQWLNDEVINGYLNLIKDRTNADGKLHVIVLNSMFLTTLKDSGYARVARWAKRAGAGGDKILQLDSVVIPIHRNHHWTLGYINVKQKRFEYYDSLATHWHPIPLLRDFMRKEVGDAYVDEEWTDYFPGNASPQQGNGYDCGVFLCKTAEVICREAAPSFSQKDIPKIRRMMQVELLKADLAAV